MRVRPAIFLLIFVAAFRALARAQSHPLDLALPTDNDAIFRGGGAEFYQHIERDYKGEKSWPWEGGQYGFVRNPVETKNGLVYTRFHEGIDIKPLHRDAAGEPLDEVRAIADGAVVYTNGVPAFSNYGNYIVIEHQWGGSPYYSLYAHLRSIAVKVGQHVAKSDAIAAMGYTGEGLNQERAHLHLELNLMLSRQFEAWHATYLKNDPNHHGLYNGINLAGLDIARLYLALRKRPALTIPDFLREQETFYEVTVRDSPHFDLRKLYPWMALGRASGTAAAWKISFTQSGVPKKIEPAAQSVTDPQISYIRRRNADYTFLTRGWIGGSGAGAYLTESGQRIMQLLTFPE